MKFKDYQETGCLYHVVNIRDLKKSLEQGIRYNDKKTYGIKYVDFHSYFDRYKPESIPVFIERQKAIFASMNFKDSHQWHSHSAILKIKVQEKNCWVCNENIANYLYEPFMLQHIEDFEQVKEYISQKGMEVVRKYWTESLSFEKNLIVRRDKEDGYDAEILINQDIPPENIECIYIVSDHQFMDFEGWKDVSKLI